MRQKPFGAVLTALLVIISRTAFSAQRSNAIHRLTKGDGASEDVFNRLLGAGQQAQAAPDSDDPAAPDANPVADVQSPQPAKVDPMALLVDGGLYGAESAATCGVHIVDLDQASRRIVLESAAVGLSGVADSLQSCRGAATTAICAESDGPVCQVNNGGVLTIAPDGSFTLGASADSPKASKFVYTRQIVLHGSLQGEESTFTYWDHAQGEGTGESVCENFLPKAEARAQLACQLKGFKNCTVINKGDRNKEVANQDDHARDLPPGHGYCRVAIRVRGVNGPATDQFRDQ